MVTAVQDTSAQVVRGPATTAPPPLRRRKGPASRRNDTWVAWLLVAPAILGFGVFFAYPMLRGVYLSFTDFNQAGNAQFQYLDQTPIGTGYRAAPEVFYFAPQKLWYLVYQNGNAAYSTNSDISNPKGWSAPKTFYSGTPKTISDAIKDGGYW